MRAERWATLHDQAAGPGRGGLRRGRRGVDRPDGRGRRRRVRFLADSETLYYAALRRYLALIEIEGGDATVADLSHLLRGRDGTSTSMPAGLMAALTATLAGLGIDLGAQSGITLDLEPRPGKSPRAFCVPVRVPGDVASSSSRGAATTTTKRPARDGSRPASRAHRRGPAAGRSLRGRRDGDRGVGVPVPVPARRPEWLAGELGMPRDAIAGWLDFGAFRKLYFLRRYGAKLLYELRLHRGGEAVVQRAEYAGLLGLLTGIRTPDASYLADVDDGLYAARYLRAGSSRPVCPPPCVTDTGRPGGAGPTPALPAGHLARRTGTIGGGRGCRARV